MHAHQTANRGEHALHVLPLGLLLCWISAAAAATWEWSWTRKELILTVMRAHQTSNKLNHIVLNLGRRIIVDYGELSSLLCRRCHSLHLSPRVFLGRTAVPPCLRDAVQFRPYFNQSTRARPYACFQYPVQVGRIRDLACADLITSYYLPESMLQLHRLSRSIINKFLRRLCSNFRHTGCCPSCIVTPQHLLRAFPHIIQDCISQRTQCFMYNLQRHATEVCEDSEGQSPIHRPLEP